MWETRKRGGAAHLERDALPFRLQILDGLFRKLLLEPEFSVAEDLDHLGGTAPEVPGQQHLAPRLFEILCELRAGPDDDERVGQRDLYRALAGKGVILRAGDRDWWGCTATSSSEASLSASGRAPRFSAKGQKAKGVQTHCSA